MPPQVFSGAHILCTLPGRGLYPLGRETLNDAEGRWIFPQRNSCGPDYLIKPFCRTLIPNLQAGKSGPLRKSCLSFLLPCGAGPVTIWVSLGWQEIAGVLRGSGAW